MNLVFHGDCFNNAERYSVPLRGITTALTGLVGNRRSAGNGEHKKCTESLARRARQEIFG